MSTGPRLQNEFRSCTFLLSLVVLVSACLSVSDQTKVLVINRRIIYQFTAESLKDSGLQLLVERTMTKMIHCKSEYLIQKKERIRALLLHITVFFRCSVYTCALVWITGRLGQGM